MAMCVSGGCEAVDTAQSGPCGRCFHPALELSFSLGLWQQLRALVCPCGSAGGAGATGTAVIQCLLLSHRWLEQTLPVYGSQAAAVLQPQLELLWTKSCEVAQYTYEQCSCLLSWVHHSLPCIVEWVRMLQQLEGMKNANVAAACRGW